MFPTTLNSQITDAVSQSVLTTVGTAQQVAAGTQFQSFVHALSMGMHNAAARQQQGQLLADTLVATALAAANRSGGT